ncbi:MAG: hypothetical protein HQL53_01535 [Magnetococcales bacterium]|nr:hypothetical protein [Magnetococcales bacterium]
MPEAIPQHSHKKPARRIDIHCHLLPGLDDGAKDIKEALGMARMIVANGVETLVATPHITPGVYDNTMATIQHTAAVFMEHLEEAKIPLKVRLAAEVRLGPHVIGLLKRGQLPLYNQEGPHRFFLL